MARKFLQPLRFKFEHPDDVKAYGDDWYVYDEYAIVNLPGQQLVEFEQEMDGTKIVEIFNGFRDDNMIGLIGSAWLAVKMSARANLLPENFSDFSPHMIMSDWERVPADELGKESAPPSTPMVSLPTLPPVESGT